jgi:hypothetical protein
MGGNKRPEKRTESRIEPRTEQVGDVEVLVEQPSVAAQAGFGKLSLLLGEQAVKCMLRRRDEDTKKWDFQDTFPVEDFSFEMVRDVFGGGEYQVQALDETGDFMKSFQFAIDRRYKGKRWNEEGGRVPVSGGSGGDNTWIAATLDKIGDAIKVMAERKPDPPPAPPDPMAMIEKLATTMRMLQPPAPVVEERTSLKDQLALVTSIVDVGTKIVDARGGGDSGGSGDAYMEMVSKLAEPVIDLVKTRATQEAARRQPRNPVTRPHLVPTPATVAAALPPASPPPVEAPMTWVQEIQKWVPMIVARCKRGRSAEDTAFFVLDELSDVTQAKLAELAALPDFATRAGQILPAELGGYPEWVTEFLAAIQDYLFGDDDGGARGDGDPEPPGDAPEVHDLDAEAQKKLAALEDAPEKEPVPTH